MSSENIILPFGGVSESIDSSVEIDKVTIQMFSKNEPKMLINLTLGEFLNSGFVNQIKTLIKKEGMDCGNNNN